MELWLLATVVSASYHPEAVQQNCGFLNHLWHSAAYQVVCVDTATVWFIANDVNNYLYF
jgi:hypothetical protein